MKILHIWNQAGVSSLLAKYQRILGHDATVLQQAKHDKAGISQYYNDTILPTKFSFLLRCITESYKHDILHLHDAWFMVLPLRLLHPKKKIIMHYHGSLVRNNTLGPLRKLLEEFVDLIIIATPDLKRHSYFMTPVYVPNPVDIKLFHPQKIHENNRCFSVMKRGQEESHLISILKKHNYDLKVEANPRNELIPYCDFPDKLRQYEYYADIPFINGEIIKAHSLCGLQALSMGIKTINYNFEIETQLPPEYDPMIVAKSVLELYDA